MGTQITIEDVLLYPDSIRTLLSFRGVRKNCFHVETHHDHKEEFLLFTKLTGFGKQICEKNPSLQIGSYYTYINLVARVAYKMIFHDADTFLDWHDGPGHPRIGVMRKIISNSIGHGMEKTKFSQDKDFCCTACATEN
jgi:hypothetical protein